MRARSNPVALLFVVVCTCGTVHAAQIRELPGAQRRGHPVSAQLHPRGTSRALLGPRTGSRMQDGFSHRVDSLRARCVNNVLNGRSILSSNNQSNPYSLPKSATSGTPVYLIDTALILSTEDTTRHVYSFNAAGKRSSDITQWLKAGHWADSLRETDTFDALNRRLSMWFERRTNGGWEGIDRYTFLDDAPWHLRSYIYSVWANDQWADQARTVVTYDGRDNLVLDASDLRSNGQWVPLYRDSMSYDAHSNLLSSVFSSFTDGQVGFSCRSAYTYDTHDHLTEVLDQELYDGRWITVGHTTYRYDQSGNETSAYGCWYQLDGQPAGGERDTMTYDQTGQLLSRRTDLWTADSSVSSERHTYAYDAFGNTTDDLTEVFANGTWVNSSRIATTYIGWLMELSRYEEQWSNHHWVIVSAFEFTYDGAGLILEELTESTTEGLFGKRSRLVYDYDAHGHLISFLSYGWVSSSWTLVDYDSSWGFSNVDDAGNFCFFSSHCCEIRLTWNPVVTGVDAHSDIANAGDALWSNYPNPFNPCTTVKFSLARESQVNLSVFDMLGREVTVLVSGRLDAGVHEVKFDGTRFASGVYYCRIQAGGFVATKKLILLK